MSDAVKIKLILPGAIAVLLIIATVFILDIFFEIPLLSFEGVWIIMFTGIVYLFLALLYLILLPIM